MTPNHESMDASEMSIILENAKKQQLTKNQETLKKAPSHVVQTTNTNSDINSAEHGSYVETEDGIGGIVIDHELEAQKMRENDETGKSLLALIDTSSLISDANEYTPDYGEDAPEGYNPGVQYINENPFDPKTRDLIKIKEGFANLTYGLHGLVDKNSDEGRKVTEALEKLRSGEVILPTPEEYERQKKEAAERKKKKQQNKTNNQNSTPVNNTQKIIDVDEDEYVMTGVPDDVVINKKGVDDLLNAINNENVKENIQTPEVTKEPEVNIEKEKVTAPINLAALEEEVKEIEEEVKPEPVETIKPEEIVEINVPKGEAETVIEHLPLDTYNKVVRAKVVKVNEIELKDVPTATRRVTDINTYKQLSRRRPSIQSAEVTERVLINSGFVVTLKSATSLEMAKIFVSPTSSTVDWEKEYQFCYEHTIGTSIGKLSYDMFTRKVSPSDIETILDGIYEISETDSRKVSINCGERDGGCGGSYEVDVEISKLPVYDSLDEKAKERIKKIIGAKNSVDETKLIVEDPEVSPMSKAIYVKCGEDRVLTIRNTTGNMMIERIDRLDEISELHGPIIALLMLYVESISITIKERDDVEPDVYLIDTVDLLCIELTKLTDEELQYVKDIITEDLFEYNVMTYSIKGPCVCPHCGNTKNEIPCSISDLVFQKAQSVLA